MESIVIISNPLECNQDDSVLRDHDYSIKTSQCISVEIKSDDQQRPTREFAKCEGCRRSRTKVLLPNAILQVTTSKNDGKTCDFCGAVMTAIPESSPGVKASRKIKSKSYVFCGECGKVVLRESLAKHIQDIHEKSNKLQCHECQKVLSGPFSLKEHIIAVHNKVMRHKCPHCSKAFSHFSNMNRHVRLIHNKMVITSKYVSCPVCQKCVQATSLKKHMKAIHDKAKEHKCTYCDKGFSQSYTLKEHIASKHTKKFEHHCSGCNRQFAHKTNYSRHCKVVHGKKDGKDKEELLL